MKFIQRKFIFLCLISNLKCQNIFQKKEDLANTFCENQMIPYGIKRSLIECARFCSLNYMCTGFFFDNAKYCFSTEKQVLNVSTCSFREGIHYVKIGMFVCCLMSTSLTTCFY